VGTQSTHDPVHSLGEKRVIKVELCCYTALTFIGDAIRFCLFVCRRKVCFHTRRRYRIEVWLHSHSTDRLIVLMRREADARLESSCVCVHLVHCFISENWLDMTGCETLSAAFLAFFHLFFETNTTVTAFITKNKVVDS